MTTLRQALSAATGTMKKIDGEDVKTNTFVLALNDHIAVAGMVTTVTESVTGIAIEVETGRALASVKSRRGGSEEFRPAFSWSSRNNEHTFDLASTDIYEITPEEEFVPELWFDRVFYGALGVTYRSVPQSFLGELLDSTGIESEPFYGALGVTYRSVPQSFLGELLDSTGIESEPLSFDIVGRQSVRWGGYTLSMMEITSVEFVSHGASRYANVKATILEDQTPWFLTVHTDDFPLLPA